MQPLNKTERAKAFFNFLLLFVLSTGIIITMVFFSVQVPFKQNDQLTKQMNEVQAERDFSKNFLNQVSAINGMLDTINTKATSPDLLDGAITAAIVKLNSQVNSDSSYNSGIYTNVVQILADLQSTKKNLRDRQGKDVNIDELRNSLDDYKNKYYQSQITVSGLTQQIIALQNRPK